MSKSDVEAANAYLAKNPQLFTDIQRFHQIRLHHPNKDSRAKCEAIHRESELTAKTQMLIEDEWHSRFIKPHLEQIESGSAGDELMYNVAGLKLIINCEDNETVRNYLKAAKLPTAAGRGKRVSYSHAQAIKFARQVVAKSTAKAHSLAASKWLKQE